MCTYVVDVINICIHTHTYAYNTIMKHLPIQIYNQSENLEQVQKNYLKDHKDFGGSTSNINKKVHTHIQHILKSHNNISIHHVIMTYLTL